MTLGNCLSNPYTLPTFNFVGGTTVNFEIQVSDFSVAVAEDISKYWANISIVNHINKNATPLIAKKVDIDASTNTIKVELTAQETVAFCGKYIYQVSLHHNDGNPEYHRQGILVIQNNINKNSTRISPLHSVPVTWGMLKNGLGDYYDSHISANSTAVNAEYGSNIPY